MSIDPMTPEGRADLRRLVGAGHTADRYALLPAADVTALLDALDKWDAITKAQSKIKVSRADRAYAQLAELYDRIREYASDLESTPMLGSSSEEQWEFDTRRIVGRELREVLDGAQ